jgi:hypothetical protein
MRPVCVPWKKSKPASVPNVRVLLFDLIWSVNQSFAGFHQKLRLLLSSLLKLHVFCGENS